MDSAPISDAPEASLHFLDYWRVIRLRKSLILTVFFLIVLTTTVVTLWLPEKFSSVAEIEVQKETPDVSVVNAGMQMAQSSDPYWLTTQFRIIESSSILNSVISNLNLTVNLPKDEGVDEPWSVQKTYERLTKHVGVSQAHGTSLIDIEVICKDKYLAAKIANNIVSVYRENRLDKWRNTHSSGILNLTNQMVAMAAELRAAEDKLNKLYADLKIQDAGFGGSSASDLINSDVLRIHQRAQAEAEDEYIRDVQIYTNILSMSWDERKEALPSLIDRQVDAELPGLSKALADAQMRWIEVTNGYGVKSAEYQSAKMMLENADREYTNRINGLVLGLQHRVERDEATVKKLKAQVEQTQTDNSALAKSYNPYFTQKREVDSLRRSYEDLSTRVSLAMLEVSTPPTSIVNVTAEAIPGDKAVSPRTFLFIAIGVFVGLIFGVGLAFFIEYLDTSVKTIDDVEHALQAPVLGVIPQNVGNILEEGPDTPHAEAYRVLQTNILFSRKDKEKNSISVLSAGAGEGKSTTLFNLATVFAQSGHRVIVVDSDLRRPSIHKILKVSNALGLTDLLLKQHNLDEVIQKTNLANLEFIASGKLPSSAMSIVGSPQMKELIMDLKRRYDFVFFDSPPLLGVHDASLLASEMDMVLQVVQYRRYPTPMTLRAKQMIAKVGGNLLGIVLNNINMSQDENYYYYSGYYEYGNQDSKSAPLAGPKDGIKPKY